MTRQVAWKVWINDLVKGKYLKEEGEFGLNYVLINDKKISRVNIIASVINKFSSEGKDYATLELDDGSGSIKVKTWKDDVRLLDNIEIGNLILIIGKPREFNNEVYILPEILKVLDNADWAKLRRAELKKEYGEPARLKEPVFVEKIQEEKKVKEELAENIPQNARQKMLSLIGSSEDVTYDFLKEKSGLKGEEVEGIIEELIKEGEVYTPRPGRIKLI